MQLIQGLSKVMLCSHSRGRDCGASQAEQTYVFGQDKRDSKDRERERVKETERRWLIAMSEQGRKKPFLASMTVMGDQRAVPAVSLYCRRSRSYFYFSFVFVRMETL